MPNDMSHIPSAPTATSMAQPLAQRARQYCVRVKALVAAPDLTMQDAASALEHLAALQRRLEEERKRHCQSLMSELARAEAQFRPSEVDLLNARMDLSHALLRARTAPGVDFGLVPHSPDPAGSRMVNTVDLRRVAAERPVSEQHVRPVSACRTLIDLEALRPYLTDHALRDAIEQHAHATGRHAVSGVAYAALPAAAHLPCEIL